MYASQHDRRVACVAFAALALAACLATPASTFECSAGTRSVCLGDVPEMQVNAATGIVVAPPVAVVPVDTGLAATTSLTSWRDFNAAHLSQKVEQSLGRGAAIPPSRVPPLPVDVWTRVQLDDRPNGSEQGLRFAAGADYKLNSRSTVGVTMNTDPHGSSAGSASETLGAYANFALLPEFIVEAKGKWAMANAAPLDPKSETSTVTLAPRISRTYLLESGQTIQPFLLLRSEIELDQTLPSSMSPSAGVGLTIKEPQSYDLSVTTTIDDVEQHPDQAHVNSKVQLKIPLP